ncbi:MAG TPA: molybdenum cofactor guanylyltransferase [Phycisphaerales bacterium]|nr:molybdenum cofactor guanylyltransferase [Phycisphaerales bacterium]
MKGVTLAVIAGGAGSRMGGPKWGMAIRGRPALVELAAAMAWEGPSVLVLGADDLASDVRGAEMFDRVVRDARRGEGPLRGVVRALAECATDWLVCVPVDMPRLARCHVEWLVEMGVASGASCAMVRRRAGSGWIVEPFPLLVRRSARGPIEEAWNAGSRAVRDLASVVGAAVLDAPADWGEEVWTNLNTPSELAEFERSGDTIDSGDSTGEQGGGR